MSKRGTLIAALTAVALGSVSAQAADLGSIRGGSIKDGGYMPAIQHSTPTGWYLRGDFAWANQGLSEIHEPPAYTLSQPSIANTRSWGVGIGRNFTSNIRGDITIDWRSDAAVRGFVSDPLATVQGERVFGVKNVLALVNVYYDFDTRSHFTPYIGVGLGFARNTTTAGHVNIAYNPAYACADVTVATCEATFDGATKTNAAGALMAGFTARLRDRLHLDAGYRFVYMGGAKTGDIQTRSTDIVTGTVTTGTATDPIVNDLHAHEFRVGLRWDINR